MADRRREGIKPEPPREEKLLSDRDHLPTQTGVEFIIRFYRLLKGATIYDRKNFIIDRLAQDCLQPINDILRLEKQLLLKIVRDNLLDRKSVV
jgi:hypothetical protein